MQPISLVTPTLGDMIDFNILLSNELNDLLGNWWEIQDAKYRTKVDVKNGEKQAFALGSADVSTETQTGYSTSITPDE